MFAKTKNIDINGTTYQIRRMDAKVGSYLVFKILGGLRNDLNKSNATGGDPTRSETTASAPSVAPDGEDIARAVVLAALSGGIGDFETHCFIQQKALEVCSRVEFTDGKELPFRIITDSGQWAAPELKEDVGLVYKLEVESLSFNLAPFFGGEVLSTAGSQVASA